MDIWDKRRRNLRALIAVRDTNASTVAKQAGMSPSYVSKFLRGEIRSLGYGSMEKICDVLGLASPKILDEDNPFSDVKNELYAHVNEMTEEEAKEALTWLQERFPEIEKAELP